MELIDKQLLYLLKSWNSTPGLINKKLLDFLVSAIPDFASALMIPFVEKCDLQLLPDFSDFDDSFLLKTDFSALLKYTPEPFA